MKSLLEIRAKLAREQQNMDEAKVLYECSGDYVRGWVAALKWVLDIPGSVWDSDTGS